MSALGLSTGARATVNSSPKDSELQSSSVKLLQELLYSLNAWAQARWRISDEVTWKPSLDESVKPMPHNVIVLYRMNRILKIVFNVFCNQFL